MSKHSKRHTLWEGLRQTIRHGESRRPAADDDKVVAVAQLLDLTLHDTLLRLGARKRESAEEDSN